jgi:diguanylate cyclase (GGDEF)-like protein/PAS domain S-box-containing protein
VEKDVNYKPKVIAASVSSEHELPVASIPRVDTIASDQVLYRFLVDSLTEYAVFAVSPTGLVISWNVGAAQTFGYADKEILGKPFDIIFTPEDALAGAPREELATALSGVQIQHDRWQVRKDGTRFWGTNTVQPLNDATGTLLGFTKLVRDTTTSHKALEALSDSEQQLRLIFESVRDYAIFSMSLGGIIKSWNAGAEKTFGYTQAEIVGSDFSVLFAADDVSAGWPAADLHKASIQGSANIERWLIRKDGSCFLASGKLSQLKPDVAGEPRGFVSIAHDVTAQHATFQELSRRARYDELTNLPNRRTFYEHVQRAIGLLKRRSTHLFAILFVDVDNFKEVNDKFGHGAADQVLASIARRLESSVRVEDVVARLGGDEFGILLNGINSVADADDAAKRIGLQMRKPITVDQCVISATLSIGIAIGKLTYDRPEDILRDADSAMYTAKLEGRARAVMFDAAGMQADDTIDVVAEIRQAIKCDELRIAYQPIIRLNDNTLVGFESLVRWEHPRRGLLLPVCFIPKAERSDLIVAIDRWMLLTGCRQLAEWQAEGVAPGLQISINVSSREFSREAFLDELRQILESSGLAPECLRLEMTESVIMEQSQNTHTLLGAIRDLGVSLDVDDFGTGFSSLAALQHFAVDALKIDSAFVANMGSDNGAKLIETILFLAHKFGLTTVAEGIETAEQAQHLTTIGCQFGQGHFFAPALDAEGARKFITEGKFGNAPPGITKMAPHNVRCAENP